MKNQVGQIDEVTIHVCDEGRRTSKYFFCQRNLLVHHMKYFERFLAENESNHDLDISVHCDIEIFEWLMNYIHSPNDKPKIEKSILVSILISSEFLQMESLVDICLKSIASRLNEIIKLPIDLSCISDKLVNQLALLTDPKVLSQTKDRKDKILNRLYKRRVELDFSRRGGNRSCTGSDNHRAIAASLTCCRHCGMVYLERFVSSLICKKSAPSISFRGNIVRRHTSIPSWSLTSYLKTLHTVMSWETIYWHVWATCIILRPNISEKNRHELTYLTISAIEIDRYTLETDGLLIFRSLDHEDATGNEQIANINDGLLRRSIEELQLEIEREHENLNIKEFSLRNEDENLSCNVKTNMMICKENLSSTSFSSSSQDSRQNIAISPSTSTFTSTLDPCRSPEILTHEIHELMSSQAKLIAGLDHRKLIENTLSAIVADTGLVSFSQIGLDLNRIKQQTSIDIGEQLWDDLNARTKTLKRAGCEDPVRIENIDNKDRGRSRSASRNNSKPPTRNNSRVPTPTNIGKGNGGGAPVSSRSMPSPSVDSIDSDPDLSSEKMRQKVRHSTSLTKKSISKTSSEKCNRQSSSSLKDSSLSSNTDDRGEDHIGKRESSQLQSLQQSDSMNVLTALPAEIVKLVEEKGVVRGMWLTSHPLEVQPLSFREAFQAVDEVGKQGQGTSAEKQLTWQLDLLREYDNQRMERYASFLATKRSPSIEDQLKAMTIVVGSNLNQQGQPKSTAKKRGSEKNQVFHDYYKDKGRQSNR